MKDTERRKVIGGRLRVARRALRLSQWDVASQVGVSQQTVANWETGRSPLDAEVLGDLCTLYGASPSSILYGQDCGSGLMGTNVVRFDVCPEEGRAQCRFMARLIDPARAPAPIPAASSAPRLPEHRSSS
jgi:transcriptional regulator with XRE-family HTH domain